MQEFIQSKTFKIILIITAIAVFELFVFQAGMLLGYHKAEFSNRYGEYYYRTFEGPGPRMFMMQDRFMGGYGSAGKIISLSLPTIVVSGKDNKEETIVVENNTQVRSFDREITPADLKLNDFIVVFGSPDENSEIKARLIRLLPEPAQVSTTTNLR